MTDPGTAEVLMFLAGLLVGLGSYELWQVYGGVFRKPLPLDKLEDMGKDLRAQAARTIKYAEIVERLAVGEDPDDIMDDMPDDIRRGWEDYLKGKR